MNIALFCFLMYLNNWRRIDTEYGNGQVSVSVCAWWEKNEHIRYSQSHQ